MFLKIIQEICQELNINYSLLSEDFVIELEYNNLKKYIYSYKFPLNDQGISLVLDDKFAFYSILKKENIKTVSLKSIYKNYSKEDLEKYLDKKKEVVVKPNNGTCGKDVYKIDNINTLTDKIDYLLNKNEPVIISPFYKIKNEYRLIVLNNEIKLIYGKKRPIIIGDGKLSILELLQEFNPTYYNKASNLQNIPYDLKLVLEKDKSLEIDFKFNLSGGSTIFKLENKNLIEKLTSLALEVARKLNIKFASIDIIETEDNELLVLEANSGIMMEGFIRLADNGYEIAKNIYKEAIISLFNI